MQFIRKILTDNVAQLNTQTGNQMVHLPGIIDYQCNISHAKTLILHHDDTCMTGPCGGMGIGSTTDHA